MRGHLRRFAGHPLEAVDPDTGRIYPVIAGGAADDPPPGDPPADPPGDDPPSDDPPADDPPGDDPLGEAGLKALRAERRARAAAEKQARDLEERLAQLVDAQKSESERAIDAAREEGRKAALTETGARVAASEAKLIATDKTSDPALAIAAMGDLSRFVSDDGTVDTDAMSAELDQVIDDHPALAKDAATAPGSGPTGGPKPPSGDGPKGLKGGIEALVTGNR